MKYLILFLIPIVTACEGPRGFEGDQGIPGVAGPGCSVLQAVNGALITCGGNTVLVLNGTNGVDGLNGIDGQDGAPGQNAPTAYSIVEIINPCGQSGVDEVLFRLGTKQIVTHYTDHGNKQYLTILTPGNYKTNDGTHCDFTVGVAPNYEVTW